MQPIRIRIPAVAVTAVTWTGPVCLGRYETDADAEDAGADMLVLVTRCTIMECPHSSKRLWTVSIRGRVS